VKIACCKVSAYSLDKSREYLTTWQVVVVLVRSIQRLFINEFVFVLSKLLKTKVHISFIKSFCDIVPYLLKRLHISSVDFDDLHNIDWLIFFKNTHCTNSKIKNGIIIYVWEARLPIYGRHQTSSTGWFSIMRKAFCQFSDIRAILDLCSDTVRRSFQRVSALLWDVFGFARTICR